MRERRETTPGHLLPPQKPSAWGEATAPEVRGVPPPPQLPGGSALGSIRPLIFHVYFLSRFLFSQERKAAPAHPSPGLVGFLPSAQ